MMTLDDFTHSSQDVLAFIEHYLKNLEALPVQPKARPGEIRAQLERRFPETGEDFGAIFGDFSAKIMPGITHWQHPMFFAYFPAGASPPSVLAEMLTAALGVQCMLWSTSPAATELEEVVMDALRDAVGLPPEFRGTIQEGGSSANLTAIVCAREAKLRFHGNRFGLNGYKPLVVYSSEEAHSSIEKAVRIAGIGSRQLRLIGTDSRFAMRPDLFEEAVERDLAAGNVPLAVVATLGTTSSAAIDPLSRIGEIAKRYGLWVHVDAAYAGSALLIPEQRGMIAGIDFVDSFVFNPHKWMLTNFDLSAFYVRDVDTLVNTFAIRPAYLKTPHDAEVPSYRDWGVTLGRRFRALKLWFVLRSYGLEGLRSIIRRHIALAADLAKQLDEHPSFELLAPASLGTVCFRRCPEEFSGAAPEKCLDDLNMQLLESLNASGEIFLSHTTLGGKTALHACVGQASTTREHVDRAFALLCRHGAECVERSAHRAGTRGASSAPARLDTRAPAGLSAGPSGAAFPADSRPGPSS